MRELEQQIALSSADNDALAAQMKTLQSEFEELEEFKQRLEDQKLDSENIGKNIEKELAKETGKRFDLEKEL